MNDLIPLITAVLNLITPDPSMKDVRLEKKELRLAKKKLRVANKTLKSIIKEFKKDGWTQKENEIIKDLKARILERKMELI